MKLFKRNRESQEQLDAEESRKLLGENLNFGAAEAYKLLRTNLEFSLADEEGCKVFGITSSMKGEGKSTTAVNIAYTLAQAGNKVLLLEADMRLPTLASRLGIPASPGLSNLLVRQCGGNDAVQKSGLIANLWVMTAGDIPPNPSELLGSKAMGSVITAMQKAFDIVIVDLPPVTAVTDAALVSKFVQGIMVVVRQDYCDRGALDETVRQLKYTGCRILGFVLTGSDAQKKNYKRYGYYNSYYKK